MAQKKKSNGKKVLPKRSARKVKLNTKARRKKILVAKPKRVKPLPTRKPVVVIAIEAEAKRSPALVWTGIPTAIMNMWLAPFERRA
jgi:hypothetical protein